MPTYERLDYGSSDGSQWGGTSTDPLAFYGITPVAQIAVSNVSTDTHASTVVSSLVAALKLVGLFR